SSNPAITTASCHRWLPSPGVDVRIGLVDLDDQAVRFVDAERAAVPFVDDVSDLEAGISAPSSANPAWGAWLLPSPQPSRGPSRWIPPEEFQRHPIEYNSPLQRRRRWSRIPSPRDRAI